MAGMQNTTVSTGPALPVATITGATTIVPTEFALFQVDATNGGFTVNLPAAASCVGIPVTLKAIHTNANLATIAAAGSDLIEGFSTITLGPVGGYPGVTLISDDRGWRLTALHGTPASVVSSAQIHTESLSSLPVSITSPVVVPVKTGTFTPQASTVLVDIDVSHEFIESLGANARWFLYVGPTGQGQLTPTVAVGPGAPVAPVVAGASYYSLGSIGSLTGALHATVTLTGLTPGTALAYEISGCVIGGFQKLSSFAHAPWVLDFATSLGNYPDQSYWGAIRDNAAGTCQLIRGRHVDRYEDVLVSVVTPTGATGGFGRVAVTPDGSKVVMTTYSSTTNNVAVITTGNNTGAAPAVQGTYTSPGTTPNCSQVVISPDGTTAWIGDVHNATVTKMTISTGVFGTPVTVGTGGAGDAGSTYNRGSMVMSPDGSFVYVCNEAAKTVVKINTSTQATSSVTLATGPRVAAISPDGSTLYAVSTTTIYKITTSNMTQAASASLPANAAAAPYAAQMFPDGRTMLIGIGSTANAGAEVQQINVPALTQAAYWKNPRVDTGADSQAYDLCLNPNGCIYITDNAGAGLNIWPGGQILFNSNQPYWPAECRIRITNAV